MVFDLRRFLQGALPPQDSPFTADLSGRDFGGVQVPAPAECNFSAQLATGGAALALAVKAEAEGQCARCLEPVRQRFDFTSRFFLRLRDLQDPDFELPLAPNGCLDVEELAYQELLLALPRVLLCSPDCPGLCPVCGQRKSACTCAPTADAPQTQWAWPLKHIGSDFTKEVRPWQSPRESNPKLAAINAVPTFGNWRLLRW